MKKSILFFLLSYIVLGCSNNQKSGNSETESTVESTGTSVDSAYMGIDSSAAPLDNSEMDLSQAEASEFNDLFTKTFGDTLTESLAEKLTKAKIEVKKGDIKEVINSTEPQCTIPKHIDQLRQSSKLKVFKFNNTMNAEAKLFGFGGNIGKKEMVIVQEFARYGTFPCSGVREKYGIGLRCFIHIKAINSKVNIEKLSSIAANVELGNLTATYELVSVGFPIQGKDLAEGTQSIGDYNVQNYAKLSESFSKIMAQLNDDNKMVLDPVSMNYYLP
ncbi:hypothetical protein [Sphingobacterium multivorum]|uniref:hypothetical protein n=1 Tax=Sphingobacterium multivorum TaxID=28454 RepID=UPI0028A6D7C5|nr:hypothetical protein [Sphingobacterium multivorum]